jgi:hypothetical protein
MSQESFEKLLSYIRHDLEVNETMANLRGGTILTEICLYVTLRWLAGGSILSRHYRRCWHFSTIVLPNLMEDM